MEEWIVYIIETESGKLYTGITTDLTRRFQEHQTKKKGARFFHTSKPQTVVYAENYPNRSLASQREHQIKKMSHLEKQDLIRNRTA